MSTARAYCVLIIKPGSPSSIQGAGVFGEPHPTLGNVHCVTLFETEGETYGDAHDKAVLILSDKYYDWCGRLERTEFRVYRDAGVP